MAGSIVIAYFGLDVFLWASVIIGLLADGARVSGVKVLADRRHRLAEIVALNFNFGLALSELRSS